MTLYGVYGASGCGRGVMPLLRPQLDTSLGTARAVFIDDHRTAERVNGHPVLTFDDFCAAGDHIRRVVLAIASSPVRARLASRCMDSGIEFFSVQAANVVIMDDVILGEGAILSPFVAVTSNVRIGKHFHANLYSYVEHDCVIGDFVTFAPGVRCNGNVHIEDHVYVGAGAIIKQGRPGNPLVIGRGAVIGMGAVVTKSVPEGATVIGNPARPM